MQSANGTGRGCAIYVSGGQNGSAAIAEQLDKCRAIAERNGWAVDDDLIFVDRDRSSKSQALTGLTHLMGAATRRRMDRVIMEHPGRLSRGVKGLRFLLQTFATQAYTSTSPIGGQRRPTLPNCSATSRRWPYSPS